MNLTGAALQLLCGALTVLAMAGAVLLAPKIRPQWARFALLLPAQLVGLLTVAIVINAQDDFYASWNDLRGVTTAPPALRVQSANGAPPPLLVHTADRFVTGHRLPSGEGRLQSVAIRGAESGITSSALVYLPQAYLDHPAERFPVLVVLTGYPGDTRNLVTQMRYPQEVDQLINERQMPPTLLVMLRPMVTPPRDTECTNVPGGPQAATFFGVDLPAAIGAGYRTAAAPRDWAVMGDSTGGYCAAKIAMADSDQYGSAVSLAGYYGALRDWTTGDLWNGSPALRDANDLFWRLVHLPQPPVGLLLTTSRQGETDFRQTMRLAALAHGPLQISTLVLPFGGHHFSVWRQEMPGALTWLGRRFTAAQES